MSSLNKYCNAERKTFPCSAKVLVNMLSIETEHFFRCIFFYPTDSEWKFILFPIFFLEIIFRFNLYAKLKHVIKYSGSNICILSSDS